MEEVLEKELRDQINALEMRIKDYEGKKAASRKTRLKAGFFLGRWLLALFIGRGVKNQFMRTWDAWLDWNRTQPWPRAETGLLGAALLARLTRVGLITGVVGVLAGLLPIYLLYQQNTLMARQGEIMARQSRVLERESAFTSFAQTTKFRTIMSEGSKKNALGSWPPPDPVIVSQFIELGRKEPKIVLSAVRPLLRDKNHHVSATAALVIIAFEKDLTQADLSWADLSYANLAGADLSGANLNNANLRHTNLSGANLNMALLYDAYLGEADLSKVNMRSANLQNAVLKKSNLTDANLSNAFLFSANLSWTRLDQTNLRKADLSKADLQYCSFGEVGSLGNFSNLEGANIFECEAGNHIARSAINQGAVFLSSGDTPPWRHEVSNPPRGDRHFISLHDKPKPFSQHDAMMVNFSAWLESPKNYTYKPIFTEKRPFTLAVNNNSIFKNDALLWDSLKSERDSFVEWKQRKVKGYKTPIPGSGPTTLDQVILQNGESILVNVVESTPTLFSYRIPGEAHLISKARDQVKIIYYRSGRIEVGGSED